MSKKITLSFRIKRHLRIGRAVARPVCKWDGVGAIGTELCEDALIKRHLRIGRAVARPVCKWDGVGAIGTEQKLRSSPAQILTPYWPAPTGLYNHLAQ